jgi:hypothetical protein
MLMTHLADLIQEGGFAALVEGDEGDDGERADDKGSAEGDQEEHRQEDEEVCLPDWECHQRRRCPLASSARRGTSFTLRQPL